MSEIKVKKRVNKLYYHLKNAILICVSIFFIYNVINELSTTKQLKDDINSANELAAQIEKERKDLEKQKEMLQDPNYVINYARGKLLISQDGEQIFSLDEK